MSEYTLLKGDCLDIMPLLPEGRFDLILVDPPYGTTACRWDSVIDLEKMWQSYRRLLKPNGAVVVFCQQPFTSALVSSNYDWFKYCWIWEKSRPGNFVHAKNRPLAAHEEIAVFSSGTTVHKNQSPNRMTYNPQGLVAIDKVVKRSKKAASDTYFSARPSHKDEVHREATNYPRTVLKFPNDETGLHPTQKPVPLLQYLIRTYTDEGGVVLDNAMGSGSTIEAAYLEGREAVGIEMDEAYYETAVKRMKDAESREEAE